MQVTNVTYNKYGTIDMTIEHPTEGMIPFTASPNDSEELGVSLYNSAIAGDYGVIATYEPPVQTIEQLVGEIKTAIQKNLDDNALLLGFEGASPMDRACSYAGFTNEYQSIALQLATRRSSVWSYVDVEFAKTQLPDTDIDYRGIPTAAEFTAEIESTFPSIGV